MYQADIPHAARVCFSDLPQEEAEAWMRRFDRHSGQSYMDPLTHAGYVDIPVSWLFCEEDRVITPQMQRTAIEMIERDAGGQKVDVTSLKGPHIPHIRQEKEVVDWIVDAARKVDKSSET